MLVIYPIVPTDHRILALEKLDEGIVFERGIPGNGVDS